jgi:hypothetical protein
MATKKKQTRAVKAPPATMADDEQRGVYVRVPCSPETARALSGLLEALDGVGAFARAASEAIGALEREGRRLKRAPRRRR